MEQLQGWRCDMAKEDRVKVCQHILDKLVEAYPNIRDREQLKNRTRSFELKIFETAQSRQDYLECIAEGLSQIDQFQRRHRASHSGTAATATATAVAAAAAQGVQGVQGIQGMQNVQARQGGQGVQNVQGVQAVQGVRNVQNVQSVQGMQGIQGMQGMQAVTGAQAQAALRHQLQNRQQSHPNNVQRQQMLAQQRNLHEIMHARNIQLQRQQEHQRQQQPLQQQQPQRGLQAVRQPSASNKPQETARKANAAAKRPPGGAEGKPITSSTKSTAAASTSSSRAPAQAPHAPTANDAEALRRVLQMNANQAAFAKAQAALARLPPSAQQEYLRALARQQIPFASQPQPSVATESAPHQPSAGQLGSQAQQFSQAGMISNVPAGQQQTSQAFPATMGIHSGNIVPQGNQNGVNMQNQNPMMADARARAGPTAQYALIAQMAAAAGLNITPQQLSLCTWEQLSHVVGHIRAQTSNITNNASLAMRRQQSMGRVNDGQAHVNPNTVGAGNINAAKWGGQPGNKAGAAGQTMLSSPSDVNRANAAVKQKHAQHAREQSQQYHTQGRQQQNAAMYGNASALAAQMKRTPGMTQAHVNAILASQKAKQENIESTLQDKPQALQQDFQNPTQTQNVQDAAGSNMGSMPSNIATRAMAPAAAASEKPAPVASTQGEIFWNKLEDIKRKYMVQLTRLVPAIRRMEFKQKSRKEQFYKFCTDCLSVLSIKRGDPTANEMDYSVLERTEGFLQTLIQFYGTSGASRAKRGPSMREGLEANAAADSGTNTAAAGRAVGQMPGAQAQAGRAMQGAHGKSDGAAGHANTHRMDPPQLTQQQQQALQLQRQAAKQGHQQAQNRAQAANVQQQSYASQQAQLFSGLNLQQQASAAQFQNAVCQQAQAGMGSGSSRVDVSKPTALAQSQIQGYACAPSASVSRVGNAGSRVTAQVNIAVPPGVAGAGRSTAAARQEAARIAGQTPTAGIGGGHSDVQLTSQAQTVRVGAPHAAVVTQGQAHFGAQLEAQTLADQRRQQYHTQQMAAMAQQQRGAVAAAGMRTNQSGTGARAESGVNSGLNGQKNAKAVEGWNAAAVGMNGALGVPRRGRQDVAKVGVLTSASGVANGAASGIAVSKTANEGNAGEAGSFSGLKAGMVSKDAKGETIVDRDAPHRLKQIINMVKEVTTQVNFLEHSWEAEAKRQKSERIQITLAALRNSWSASASDEAAKKGKKARGSLADVDNYEAGDGVIETKTVFECSPESGLRLAKKPRHEPGDMQLLREAVKMDVKAARDRNPRLDVKVIEEYGHPVVVCMLNIAEMRLPKLTLRVQRGYPRKGGATYGFERPPMGWVGQLEEVRMRFRKLLSISPAASVGVAAILDAWASEAEAVINGSEVSDQTKVSV